MEALRKYQEGVMSGDGMRELYTQRLDSKVVIPLSAINIIVTPSHWITGVNVRVDRAIGEVPTVDLTRALRRHYAYAPSEKYMDHYQLVPRVLLNWLRDRSAADSNSYNEDRYSHAWEPGRGICLHWLTARQQWHAQRHRMHTMPTREVMAKRAAHYKQIVPTRSALQGRCGDGRTRVEVYGH